MIVFVVVVRGFGWLSVVVGDGGSGVAIAFPLNYFSTPSMDVHHIEVFHLLFLPLVILAFTEIQVL